MKFEPHELEGMTNTFTKERQVWNQIQEFKESVSRQPAYQERIGKLDISFNRKRSILERKSMKKQIEDNLSLKSSLSCKRSLKKATTNSRSVQQSRQ